MPSVPAYSISADAIAREKQRVGGELVRGVAIALERAPVEDCTVLDSDANGAVTVDELLGAVGNLLEGCSETQPLSRPPAALGPKRQQICGTRPDSRTWL